MRGFWTEFKDFALKGNLIELAVAVVLGVAFNDVIQAVVRDLVTPLIGALFGEQDFSQLDFTINSSRFPYGDLINYLIRFLVVALVLFMVIKAASRFQKRTEATTRPCDFCTLTVDRSARRCPHCTSELVPA